MKEHFDWGVTLLLAGPPLAERHQKEDNRRECQRKGTAYRRNVEYYISNAALSKRDSTAVQCCVLLYTQMQRGLLSKRDRYLSRGEEGTSFLRDYCVVYRVHLLRTCRTSITALYSIVVIYAQISIVGRTASKKHRSI